MEGIVTATYDQDSKRYHRFVVDEGQGGVGTIYIPKDKPIPDTITIKLRTNKGGEKSNG